jgi:hypothetical protein
MESLVCVRELLVREARSLVRATESLVREAVSLVRTAESLFRVPESTVCATDVTGTFVLAGLLLQNAAEISKKARMVL